MKYRIFERKTPTGWQATEVILRDADGVVCGWAMRRQNYVPLPAERIEDVTVDMLRRPPGTELRGSDVLTAPDGTKPLDLLKPIPTGHLAPVQQAPAKQAVTLKRKVKVDEETREHAYPEVLNAIDLEQRRRDSEAKAIALGVSPRIAAKWFRAKEEK